MRDYRDVQRSDQARAAKFNATLRAEGLFKSPGKTYPCLALTEEDLHDLYRVRNSDANEFSWWDYRGGSFHRNHGLRIDFVLGSSGLIELCSEAVIDRDFRKKKDGLNASDHAPVYVDIDL